MASRFLFLLLCLIPAVAATKKPAPAVKFKDGTPAQIAAAWMKTMSPRDKAAQLIIAPCFGENPNVRSADYKRFSHWVQDLHIGGLIVLNRVVYGTVRNAEPVAMASFLNQMQRLSPLPLIIGSDLERGASMRIANTVKFPHNMAYAASGDLSASRFEGAETAREARALGIHWIFAPVADVNNNPDNPIINIRSYGEQPSSVAAHVAAYIEGAHSDPNNRVLVTVKHFPGHGDTAVDTHLGLPVIGGDRARLDAVELVPFKAAIAHNVDAVMTGHLSVPALEPLPIPATVSKAILTDLLRKELGFQGLIITDGMDMAGLTKMYSPAEAAVKSLEAGVDILLMPANVEGALKGILLALDNKTLSIKRLDQSVQKILEAKVRLGLNKKRFVDLEAINTIIESPESESSAQSETDHAVTLVKNDKDVFPLSSASQSCLYLLPESKLSRQGLKFMEQVTARAPELRTTFLDPGLPQMVFDDVVTKSQIGCKTILVAAFASITEYKGDTALAGGYSTFLQNLLKGSAPVGLISLGNPYLLRNFPTVAAYATTYSTTSTAEVAAVKTIFGEIPLTGRLPVNIPGYAKLGDGIQLPARK